MAQVGRISGPLLTANLERQGKDLDFRNQQTSTPLLKLKVGTNSVGITTSTYFFRCPMRLEVQSISFNERWHQYLNNDINALTDPPNIKSDKTYIPKRTL